MKVVEDDAPKQDGVPVELLAIGTVCQYIVVDGALSKAVYMKIPKPSSHDSASAFAVIGFLCDHKHANRIGQVERYRKGTLMRVRHGVIHLDKLDC